VSENATQQSGPVRRVLLLAHTGREDAREVARAFCKSLTAHGIVVRLLADEASDLGLDPVAPEPGIETVTDAQLHDEDGEGAGEGCELAVVIGADGTILRAAEMTHLAGTPLLGVNLGHVGFLAEAEYDDVDSTIAAIVERRYTAEERLTIDVQVYQGKELVTSTFALNEVSVEKAARERMLEVAVEIDGKPLSAFGCDGIVVSTPTGSTAYAFSLGGPVIWPDVEAILMVPNAAHALFSRPIVVSPTSRLAVEVIPEAEGHGIMWCDGRRQLELRPGARIEVTRSDVPVRLARLNASPFTDRLVAKFDLSVAGWRGNGRSR
jgi:NAD+ kinase